MARFINCGFGIADCGLRIFSQTAARSEATPYRVLCGRLFLVGPGRPRPAVWLCCHVSRAGASGGHALPGFVWAFIFGRAGASRPAVWLCRHVSRSGASGGHALPGFVWGSKIIQVSKYEANLQAFDRIPSAQDSPKCSSISHPCFRCGEACAQRSPVATESRRFLL